jgi:GWxTD domain-containing protein
LASFLRSRSSELGWLIALAFLAGAAPGEATGARFAQPPADLCALADSLALANPADLSSLVQVSAESGGLAVGGAAGAGLAALSLGLAMGSADYFDQALDHFEDAEDVYQEDACFFYYRGLIRRELGTKGFFAAEVWARLTNRDNVELAIRDFAHASELRPDWLSPIMAMVDLGMHAFEGKPGRRERWLGWAMTALDRYSGSDGAEPQANLWRGRILMEAGLFQDALSAFNEYWARTNSVLARFEAARALFALGDAEQATTHYLTALDGLADSAFAAELERDIYFIFAPGEADGWADQETGAERSDWVKQFWSQRAARDLVSEEERLAEHYSRLRWALKAYRRTSEASLNFTTDRFGNEVVEKYDDRGLIYIRMGEPHEEITCLLGQAVFQSWIYPDDEGRNAAIHFTAGGDVDDWSLAAVLPSHCYTRLGYQITDYYTMALRLESGRLTALSESRRERLRAERFAGDALASDQHRLPLDRRLEFGYEWLFFRGTEPASIEATLSYAVPAKDLDCQEYDEGRACDLRVRASIFSANTVVDRLEVSSRAWTRYKLDWILGHTRGRAFAGLWYYRVAVFEPLESDPDRNVRGNIAAGRFIVPAFLLFADSTRVSVSSLVLARPGNGSWRRGTHALALNPLHTYPPNATVDVYYEIYGLPEDRTFVTEITLLKERNPPTQSLDPSSEWLREVLEEKEPELQLRFEESGFRDGRPWLERRKTLTLRDVRPGKYVLVLDITPPPPATTVYRLSPLVIDRMARPW